MIAPKKVATSTSFLLLAIHAVNGQYSTLTTDPKCAKFPAIEVSGLGQFVDTDNSGPVPFPITAGDMSIAASLAPASLPINTPYFRVQNLDIQAICTTTADGSFAPSCHLEVDFKFCRRLTAAEAQTQRINGGGRNLRENEQNQENRDLQIVSSGCYGTREGKFTASGTGPDPFAITGGTEDLFGAFGQLITDGTFTSDPVGMSGDVELSFFGEIQICYWQGP